MTSPTKRVKFTPTGDYKVGYCRPPKEHQFGQKSKVSASPHTGKGGGPATVAAILDEPLTVVQSGKKRRIHPYELALISALKQVKSGHMRSLVWILEEFERHKVLIRACESGGGVVVVPKEVPFDIGVILFDMLGRPPWPRDAIDYFKARPQQSIREMVDVILKIGFGRIRWGK